MTLELKDVPPKPDAPELQSGASLAAPSCSVLRGEDRRRAYSRVRKCEQCGKLKKVWALNDDGSKAVCGAACLLALRPPNAGVQP